MAFVCVLTDRAIPVEHFQKGSDHLAMCHIGRDDNQNRNYFAAAILSPQAGGGIEFVFRIIEVNGVTKEEFSYHSGRDTPFIQGEDRRLVLNAILVLTEFLVRTVRPDTVFRCTADDNLPAKAMEKHERINELLEKCGYKVTRGEPYHGKCIWYATRV